MTWHADHTTYNRLDLPCRRGPEHHGLEAPRGQVALEVVHRDRLLERGAQEKRGGSRRHGWSGSSSRQTEEARYASGDVRGHGGRSDGVDDVLGPLVGAAASPAGDPGVRRPVDAIHICAGGEGAGGGDEGRVQEATDGRVDRHGLIVVPRRRAKLGHGLGARVLRHRELGVAEGVGRASISRSGDVGVAQGLKSSRISYGGGKCCRCQVPHDRVVDVRRALRLPRADTGSASLGFCMHEERRGVHGSSSCYQGIRLANA